MISGRRVWPTVWLVCPGLDHAHRGFETFARECFEALRDRDDIMIQLVKGTGPRTLHELVVPTLTRDTLLARLTARLWSVEPFIVEHVAFTLALLPLLVRHKPDVVYFSEWHVGRILANWRSVSRQSFALVFCNGALAPGRYGRIDRVQQLVGGAIEYTVQRGESSTRQELLPLGVRMHISPACSTPEELTRLRSRLSLPEDRHIVMSAGAINHQKRMSYLVQEIGSMPEPRPYLLLLGEQEPDSTAIKKLALRRLGPQDHDIRTAPPDVMADYYRASDVFVLASLWESFGRVLVEAQSHGLPCLAHDYPVMRWILGSEGDTADLRKSGQVVSWLRGLTDEDLSLDARLRRYRSVYDRFSWEVLADRYVHMLRTAAQIRERTH